MNNSVDVQIKRLYKDSHTPTQGSAAAAGWDLYAYIPKGFCYIEPHTTEMIGTGLALGIQEGWEGSIYARSGLASKKGLAPANKVGVIDSDYRGEIMIALHNHTNEVQRIDHGERIAQILFFPVPRINWKEVTKLDETNRGAGGFGSTGEK